MVRRQISLYGGRIRNYRPISGLTFMSKVIEKVVARQLVAYLACHDRFLNSSLDFVVVIPPRRQSFVCSRTSSRLSIAAASCFWLFLMSVPPSIRWTMTSCWSGSLRPSVLQVRYMNGSVRSWHPALIPSALEIPHRHHHRSDTGSHRVRFLGLCYISSTQQMSSVSSSRLVSRCSFTLMTLSCMVTVYL